MQKSFHCALAAAALALVGATLMVTACRSPVQESGGSEAAVTLSFHVAGVKEKNGAARLLLPTFESLSVEMAPVNPNYPAVQTRTATAAELDANFNLPISYPDLPLTSYDVYAYATDAAGEKIFAQRSRINLSRGSTSATLNLVPLETSGVVFDQLTADVPYGTQLGVGESRTWVIPASAFSGGAYHLWVDAGTDVLVFGQRADGQMVNADPTGRIVLDSGVSGDSFLTVYNAGDVSEDYRVFFQPTGSASVYLSLSGSRIVFTAPPTVAAGNDLVVTTLLDGLPYTGWSWYLDGGLLAGQTGSGLTLATTNAMAGHHTLSSQIVSGGVAFSGSFGFTVAGSATDAWTVVYSSQGADTGAAPMDANLYASGDRVTVKANTGSLASPGLSFLGWTTASDGSGTVYSPGDEYAIGADTTFYPKWESAIEKIVFSAPGTYGINITGNATVRVKAWGAGGGGGNDGGSYTNFGGGGGYAVAAFTATAGQTLHVVVGRGGNINSGGDATMPGSGGASVSVAGGGGGGASLAAIESGGTYTLKICGGGGGGGGGGGINGEGGGRIHAEGAGDDTPGGDGASMALGSATLLGFGGKGGDSANYGSGGGGGGYGGGGAPGWSGYLYGGYGGGSYGDNTVQGWSDGDPQAGGSAVEDYIAGAGYGGTPSVNQGGDGLVVVYITY